MWAWVSLGLSFYYYFFCIIHTVVEWWTKWVLVKKQWKIKKTQTWKKILVRVMNYNDWQYSLKKWELLLE